MRKAERGTLRVPVKEFLEIEGIVRGLKRQVGVEEDEIPWISDSWRLIVLEGDRLDVRIRDLEVPMSMVHPSGRGSIWLPEGWEETRLERGLLEEYGHYRLTVLAFDTLPEGRGAQQLYKLWEQRDESRVRAFVLIWLIPEAKLFEFAGREPELAELCRCSEQDVWDRLGLYS